MNRFHVHVSVKDLDESIRFYSKLFGAGPTVAKPDYAKWMLEDPRINFAISHNKCGGMIGLNHLGLQVDSEAELAALEHRFAEAELSGVIEHGATCCYAKSDKTWLQDPQGLIWENFHTLEGIPTFGAGGPDLSQGTSCMPENGPAVACCAPAAPVQAESCCVPKSTSSSCC